MNNGMRRHWSYLRAVLRHKWFVFLSCIQWGVPIWTAIAHDWDKFLPDEWFPYAQTFYNEDGTSKREDDTFAFAKAWMKHQQRNKHHWQYWLIFTPPGVRIEPINVRDTHDMLFWDDGHASFLYEGGLIDYPFRLENTISAAPMSEIAMREMIADWFGAGRAYMKNWTPLEPLKWFKAREHKMILHPDTKLWIEVQLHAAQKKYLLKHPQ